jgi:hypothetical protein
MTLSESILGKRISDLSQSDLETYFTVGRKEANNIEFKSYIDHPAQGGSIISRDKEKLQKIFSSIGAFLNTGGGILIWGAPTGNKLAGDRDPK